MRSVNLDSDRASLVDDRLIYFIQVARMQKCTFSNSLRQNTGCFIKNLLTLKACHFMPSYFFSTRFSRMKRPKVIFSRVSFLVAVFVCNMRKYLTENYPFLEKIPPTIFLQLQSFCCYHDSSETIVCMMLWIDHSRLQCLMIHTLS